MVLVIIILVAWAVILGPSLLKRRARGGDHSITHFQHQLRILEHSTPEPLVAPAYRLRTVDERGTPTAITYPDCSTPPKLTVVGAKELPRPALAFLGEPAPEPVEAPMAQVPVIEAPRGPQDRTVLHGDDVGYLDERVELAVAPGRPRPPRSEWTGFAPPPVEFDDDDDDHRAESFARQQARRRRRDTLAVLAAVFLTTLVFGAVTGASALWALCALDAVALAAYVAVLVHLQRLAVERERKLHYIDGRDRARGPRAGGLPTQVSGRYAHPSNQQAVAH